MTFNPQKFGNIGSHVKSGTSYQLFSYLGDVDTKATITEAGYFNEIKESLKRNDIIKVLDRTVTPAVTYELRVSVLPLNSDVLVEELLYRNSSVNKALTYNIDGTLDEITDSNGTKTMVYNIDGTLGQIEATGIYESKEFVYSVGKLTEINIV